MSCFNNNCYLPEPPRAWSRVQNSCSLITDTNNNDLVIDPYTGQLVTAVVLAERIVMLNKGNILQYKANSSNLTKSQKYSKIAKGQWVNRNTTWASQSTRGYTNPNTTSLKRDGNINIAIDPITGAIIGPTLAPPTCPQPVIPINNGLPSNGGGGSDIKEPNIPPPIEPSPGSNVFPAIIPDTPVEPIVIQDGGNLICSIYENICTGEIKQSLSQQLCHPTTDSDVPGPIQDLCWNDGTQTWYPRQRYIMTNSTNKWPVNAELFGAIIINAPVITSISSDKNIVTLTWTFNSSTCLPASNFNIYQDGVLIEVVNSNVFTTILIVSNCNTYEYYIKAENITAKTISEASNVVSIQIAYPEPPSNVTAILDQTTPNLLYSVNVTWTAVSQCCNNYKYNLYYNGLKISGISSSTTSYTLTNLSPFTTYTIYMETVCNGNKSDISNLSSVYILPMYNTTNSTLYTSGNTYLLLFTTNGTLTFNYTITDIDFLIIAGGGGGGLQSNLNNYPGGGGGGGGYLYTTTGPISSFISDPTTTISATIGLGGLGAPTNGTNKGYDGSNTTITPINGYTYAAVGGFGSNGANGTDFDGTGGYSINGTLVTNSNQTGNFGFGGNGGSGDYDLSPQPPSSASNNNPFTLPFTVATYSTINISGGGGAANTSYGGGCGNGNGGSLGGNNPSPNGANASNALPSFGGGGGGGCGTVSSGNIGGNGGQGMCMIWWTI